MQKREVVCSDRLPAGQLPISQAIRVGTTIYCSGHVATDPATGLLMSGDIEAQTARVLQNLNIVLEAAGSSLQRVVKATVFLAAKEDFAGMNRVFAQYFPKDPPARSTIRVDLMGDAKIEIEVIAVD